MLKKNNKFLICIAIIVSLLLSLSACSQQSNVKTSPKVPNHITIKRISKENLSPWKITLNNVHKKGNQWVCDIKVINTGGSILNSPSFEIGGATLISPNIEPNSAFTSKAYPLKINSTINISLGWRSNGKNFKGKAVYEVK